MIKKPPLKPIKQLQPERAAVKTFSTRPKPLPAQKEEPPVLLGVSTGGATTAGWHSVESFLRCPKEFQFQHVRGLREPTAQLPDHFAVGSLLHAGRARWFASRFATDAKTWDAIKAAIQHEAEIQRLPVSLQAEQAALRYTTEYIEHWSRRPLPKPIAAEYDLGPAPIVPGDPFTYRTARLDDVSKYAEASDGLYLGEAKTTSAAINDCLNQYTLHGQPLLQLALWRTAPQGQAKYGPVKGFMLDIIQKGYGKEKSKFARFPIRVSDYALDWYIKSMRGYLRAAAQVDWDTDVPRNISSCTRAVGRGRFACPYRDLCGHGKGASTKFVDRDGNSLVRWQPSPGKTVPPWE